jgi:hypothetical protein
MATLLNRPAHPPADKVADTDETTQPTGLRRVLGLGLNSRRAKRWAVFCVLFLVADVAIAAIAIALVRHHSDNAPRSQPAQSQPAQSQPAPALPKSTPVLALTGPAAWMSRELPHTAGVLAMDPVKSQLSRAGFGKVLGISGLAPGQVQYLVSNAALRAGAKNNAVIAQLLTYSAPIATFGAGANQIVVRQTTATPDGSRIAHHAQGVKLRASQERQLLENPRLRFNTDGERILRAGGLDLRAASVLAQLASSTPLQVQIVVDPAERSAGVPARRIVISSNAPDKVHAVLAALPASYRLAADDHIANNTERLVWPIDPDPAIAN